MGPTPHFREFFDVKFKPLYLLFNLTVHSSSALDDVDVIVDRKS
jgi:hypothetical protein